MKHKIEKTHNGGMELRRAKEVMLRYSNRMYSDGACESVTV